MSTALTERWSFLDAPREVGYHHLDLAGELHGAISPS